jgi:ribosomal protein S8
MLQEAQKQNTTLETLVLKSLQKDYGANSSSDPSPATSILNFFTALSDGMKTGQSTVQIPADEISQQIAESLKYNGTLLDFQASTQQITLYLKPPLAKSSTISSLSEIDLAELDPEIANVVEDFKHEDENIRAQAIRKVAQWYGQ